MIAFDSNILIYAAGIVRDENDVPKIARAGQLMQLLVRQELFVAVQALGEFANVARKVGRPREIVMGDLSTFRGTMTILPTGDAAFETGLEIAFRHRLQVWDAIIIAASSMKGARYLLSEDMQHGFVWRGMQIVNPLLEPPEIVVARLLDA